MLPEIHLSTVGHFEIIDKRREFSSVNKKGQKMLSKIVSLFRIKKKKGVYQSNLSRNCQKDGSSYTVSETKRSRYLTSLSCLSL